jgi:hypothetical protein
MASCKAKKIFSLGASIPGREWAWLDYEGAKKLFY